MPSMIKFVNEGKQLFFNRYTIKNRRQEWLLALCLVVIFSLVSCAQSVQEDAEWLKEALEIKEGSVVAEIGAGNGYMTLTLAEEVGSSGHVYSSELGADSVQFLRDVVQSDPVSNVTVIEGDPTKTNFPKECCDALFMRNVYHHFDDPAAMNQSIRESLKPGGRLAIIDFAPSSSESSDAKGRDAEDFQHHGVSKETVIDELQKAGFTLLSSEERSDRDIYIVVQK